MLSSVVEHILHTDGVAGSNPAACTIPKTVTPAGILVIRYLIDDLTATPLKEKMRAELDRLAEETGFHVHPCAILSYTWCKLAAWPSAILEPVPESLIFWMRIERCSSDYHEII